MGSPRTKRDRSRTTRRCTTPGTGSRGRGRRSRARRRGPRDPSRPRGSVSPAGSSSRRGTPGPALERRRRDGREGERTPPRATRSGGRIRRPRGDGRSSETPTGLRALRCRESCRRNRFLRRRTRRSPTRRGTGGDFSSSASIATTRRWGNRFRYQVFQVSIRRGALASEERIDGSAETQLLPECHCQRQQAGEPRRAREAQRAGVLLVDLEPVRLRSGPIVVGDITRRDGRVPRREETPRSGPIRVPLAVWSG